MQLDLKIDTSDLVKRLEGLAKKVAAEVLTTALTESGSVIQAAIKQAVVDRAPRGASGAPREYKDPNGNSIPPELLAEDIDIDPFINRSGESANVEVGPTELTDHVARWINDGWMHTHGGKRRSTSHPNAKGIEDGQIPGTHFMEAGFDESAQAALDVFTGTLSKGIEEAYQK